MYSTEAKAKNSGGKLKSKQTDMHRSIAKQSGGIRRVSPEKEEEGNYKNDLQKRKI